MRVSKNLVFTVVFKLLDQNCCKTIGASWGRTRNVEIPFILLLFLLHGGRRQRGHCNRLRGWRPPAAGLAGLGGLAGLARLAGLAGLGWCV